MIIWTCMRTGSTVFINHLMRYNKNLTHVPEYITEFKTYKKEYGKIWSYENLNPNQNKNDWLTWIKSVDYYNLDVKIYDRKWNEDFYKTIINNTKKSKHVILYRENCFDRVISHWFRLTCLSLDKKSITMKKINIDECIKWEISARNHFMNVIRFTDCEIISYEDIFVKKDIEKIKKIFPDINPTELYNTSRYDYHQYYNQLENYDLLKEKMANISQLSFN